MRRMKEMRICAYTSGSSRPTFAAFPRIRHGFGWSIRTLMYAQTRMAAFIPFTRAD
jgi:hypothetical protein